jgi:hypothetical protein
MARLADRRFLAESCYDAMTVSRKYGDAACRRSLRRGRRRGIAASGEVGRHGRRKQRCQFARRAVFGVADGALLGEGLARIVEGRGRAAHAAAKHLAGRGVGQYIGSGEGHDLRGRRLLLGRNLPHRRAGARGMRRQAQRIGGACRVAAAAGGQEDQLVAHLLGGARGDRLDVDRGQRGGDAAAG